MRVPHYNAAQSCEWLGVLDRQRETKHKIHGEALRLQITLSWVDSVRGRGNSNKNSTKKYILIILDLR